MVNKILEDIADQLRQSGEYRIINKYHKPEGYNTDSSTDKKLIGVFLDIEATGLFYATDKLIELGMVKFEYTEDGRIFRLLDEFNRYKDPGMPIPEAITKLTGITNDMVKGHQINVEEVDSYLIEEEINYLRSEIYNSSINIPIEVFDAYSRFSNHYGNSQNTAKYQDKIEMVKMLCLK